MIAVVRKAPPLFMLAIMARDGNPEAKDLLDKACQSHNIFAAFMRILRATIVGESNLAP